MTNQILRGAEGVAKGSGVLAASTLLVGSAIINLNALGLSLLYAPDVIFHYIANLLAWLGLRKKREPYGVVYDSITKEPLQRAVVRIYSEGGKLIDTVFTDLYGVFEVGLEAGRYTFVAKRPGYSFPSKYVVGKNDVNYDNVYDGKVIDFGGKGEVDLAIPMDPIDSSFNSKLKTFIRSRSKDFFNIFNWSLLGIGLSFAVIAEIINPTLFNTFILLLYVPTIALVLKSQLSKPVKYAKVVDSYGNPVSGLTLGLNDLDKQAVVAKHITDSNGLYRFIAPSSHYRIEILSKGYTVASKEEMEVIGHGKRKKVMFVGKDIVVEKLTVQGVT